MRIKYEQHNGHRYTTGEVRDVVISQAVVSWTDPSPTRRQVMPRELVVEITGTPDEIVHNVSIRADA